MSLNFLIELPIQPPSKSDRIASPTKDENVASPVTTSPIAIEIMPNMETSAHDQSAPETNSLVKVLIPQRNGQLAFLKFAVDRAADPGAATNRGRKKERLL